MPTKKLRVVQKLDLRRLMPDDLEYFCISDDIDREVMNRKGKTYNEDLAFNALYFVVTRDKRIAVIPKREFDPWRERRMIDYTSFAEKSEAAKEAIDFFIRDVHGIREVV